MYTLAPRFPPFFAPLAAVACVPLSVFAALDALVVGPEVSSDALFVPIYEKVSKCESGVKKH